jgi:hypothetical protein
MVDATPNVPVPYSNTADANIKVASPDIVLITNESLPVELMANLTFENIGGREILNIARHDTINGQSIIYQPIGNLAEINLKYNPLNILALQNTSDKLFRSFAIELGDHIPTEGNGENGNHVYLDSITGDIVVDLINLDSEYEVEIQVLSSGDILDDTIYEQGIS